MTINMFTDIIISFIIKNKKNGNQTTKKNSKKEIKQILPFPVYSSYYHQVFIKPTTSLYKLLFWLLLRYGCNGCLVWRLKADNSESHCTKSNLKDRKNQKFKTKALSLKTKHKSRKEQTKHK